MRRARLRIAVCAAFLCALSGCASLEREPFAAEPWETAEGPPAPDTGACKPLLRAPGLDSREDERKRSCWNRLWEVPVVVAGVPIVILALAGIVTAPIWVPLILIP